MAGGSGFAVQEVDGCGLPGVRHFARFSTRHFVLFSTRWRA